MEDTTGVLKYLWVIKYVGHQSTGERGLANEEHKTNLMIQYRHPFCMNPMHRTT
jgi:hypothetical protein